MGKIKESQSVIVKAAKRNGVVLSTDTLNKFEMTSVIEGESVSRSTGCVSVMLIALHEKCGYSSRDGRRET